jgi:hypothetical protein
MIISFIYIFFIYLIEVTSKWIFIKKLIIKFEIKVIVFVYIVCKEFNVYKNSTRKSVILGTVTLKINKTSVSKKSTILSIYKSLGLLQILAGLILIASLIICFSKRKRNIKKNDILNKNYFDRVESNENDEFNPYSNKDGSINKYFGHI